MSSVRTKSIEIFEGALLALHNDLETLERLMLQNATSLVGRPLNIECGIDFYDEVRRFEIALIKQALRITGGHQGRAALLLGLNSQTLNSKMKAFRINSAYPSLANPRTRMRRAAG